ncbi:MAG TPA: tail fiber protein [Mobilitalea sp.]|nr:tail fiber protein [Mobilitalea sp.]
MDYFIGTIIAWANTFEPYGWLYCDGRSLPVEQYPALYAVIGNRYGGDSVNFNLPNLNGRVAVGSIAGGASGGVEMVTLNSNQTPVHGHDLQANTNSVLPGANIPDANKGLGVVKSGPTTTAMYKQYTSPSDLVGLNNTTLSSYGTQGAHTNLQPYLAMKYIICIYGEFPARP